MSSINISQQNIYGNCDLKCSYTFKYGETDLIATNNNVMISLTCDKSSVPPVKYNNNNYNVDKINIVSPSLHIFEGSKTSGEIMIEHSPERGGNNLVVCIPIINSGDNTIASNFLTQIINDVSLKAPQNGDTTTIIMSNNFSLNSFIPNKPYFNYNYNTNDYIVFGSNYGIPLTSNTLNTLKKMIKPFPLNLFGNYLFYNAKGPNTTSNEVGDGIYISCKPTDVTEEKMNIIVNKNTTSYDLQEIFKSQGFQTAFIVIVSCFLFIILFYGISYGYMYFTKDSDNAKINLSSLQSLQNILRNKFLQKKYNKIII